MFHRSHNTVKSDIVKLFLKMKAKVQSLLEGAGYVAISLDIWAQKGLARSFVGVCATFFNEQKIMISTGGKLVWNFSH